MSELKRIPSRYKGFTWEQIKAFIDNYVESGDVVSSLESVNPQLKKYDGSQVYSLGLKILSNSKVENYLNQTIREKFLSRGINPDDKFFEILNKAEKIAEDKGDAKAMVQLANLYSKIISSEKEVQREVELTGTGKFTPEELERLMSNSKVKMKVKEKTGGI